LLDDFDIRFYRLRSLLVADDEIVDDRYILSADLTDDADLVINPA